ncbi:MAG TPA: CHAD domain-containing protein, partial [Acetobacteraceae bacterium]|nr:CHAD domain-containing protein [Acetobacteraceae bacterium]
VGRERELEALDGADPAKEVARRIIDAEVAHLLANQPGAAAGDMEGVHQMRVGIRRLRTLLVLFGKQFELHATARFEAELKRLGQLFGAARDWDVFCTEVLDAAGQDKRVKGWTELLRPPAETERRAAHQAVADELGRPALTALLLGMVAWVEPDESGQAVLGRRKLERPIAKLAPSLLDRMERRVNKRGGNLRRRPPAELHELRKALKKLRYSAEYLGGLYPSKQVRPFQKASKRLLKLLGAYNDASVATALAERLCSVSGSDLVPAASALAAWAEKRHAKAEQKLGNAWAAFAATPPFWS